VSKSNQAGYHQRKAKGVAGHVERINLMVKSQRFNALLALAEKLPRDRVREVFRGVCF
jgi:hypothetical protein